MRDYEDLVKSLRYCAEYDCTTVCPRAGTGNGCITRLKKEAADAIEELSREYESIAKSLNESVELVRKLQRPCWVSVTERLPEDGSLVGKLIADSDGNIRIASQCAEITLSGGKTVYTDLIDLVSLLAEDTPTIEWEDCTHITHWMPLPEPPKE